MRGLQIRAGFRDYKSGQEGLQIGAALGISNRGKEITNRDRGFKSGKRDFKLGQRLQIEARGISNRGRDYKSVLKKLFVLVKDMTCLKIAIPAYCLNIFGSIFGYLILFTYWKVKVRK